jgi:hypothetical protein
MTSFGELKCNRFGYARLYNNIIVKIKANSITDSYANGFRSNEYTLIESYDFFTKKQCNEIPTLYGTHIFFFNETDAYFYFDYSTFGNLTGIYEFKDIDGNIIVNHLSNGKLHRYEDLPAEICYSADYSNPQKLKIPGKGNKRFETWWVNGKVHRDGDLPVYNEYYENGDKKCKKWAVDGKWGRDGDLPSTICYYENGKKVLEAWCKSCGGDLPYVISYYKNGTKSGEKWFLDGKVGRDEDLHAEISYYENGNKQFESWVVDGKVGRRDRGLPAAIHYYVNGNKKTEEWWVNDERHRDGDQPAKIKYYETGNKQCEEWWNGDYLSHRIEYYENCDIKCDKWYADEKGNKRINAECKLKIE